ncbi:ubiquitin-protein transferase activity protein [Coemansia spiralis]|uniref:Ubiquitin-protein transferase activity protein n=2 Tax=Coemansia TaxID=4863 RepID=A0A9W8KVS0_9FUNG|nr:ubiquitin-protein transferase activity protein [Coemansia umbellata]KAJ2618893.1 ubiquitin-protein transferase activity protein [Coemansia sp. RSA 1358]KAJ2669383.1 ubiquitin-protein transferase activity protein [Coemansia spiralis]
MHSLFRRSEAIRGPTNQRSRQRPTWEERARAALAAAREVEEASGESVPTRPSEVNVSRRLFYGPRYILPGTHTNSNEAREQEQREQHQQQLQHEEPCDVLQANMALDVTTLHMSSLMVGPSVDSTDAVTQSPLFTLTFSINTLVPLKINLYWLATEAWDLSPSTDGINSHYPQFFSRVNTSRSYSIGPGLGQKFALPRSDWLDPEEEPYCTLASSDWQSRLATLEQISYSTPLPVGRPSASTNRIMDVASTATKTIPVQLEGEHGESSIEMKVLQSSGHLTTQRESEIQELLHDDPQKAQAYGLVIELVDQRDDQAISTESPDPPNSQISFIDFFKDGASHIIPRCVKQKLFIDGKLYVQHEIFGLNEIIDSRSGVDKTDSMQCAICLSDERDTVLLPCRHLCMCRECANTYRQQSNKCPICRTVVETILHIESKDDC